MPGLIQSLDSVSLHVRDIQKARDFYTRILGLKEIHYDDKAQTLLVATPEGARLSMHVMMPGEAGREPGTISGIIFRVADAKKAMEEVQRRGGKAYDYWAAPWKMTYVTVADPDGNEMLLAEHTP